jgi:hypothetical protein
MLASGLFALAGCGPKAPPPTVHASMTEVVAPQAQTIWDITNRAYTVQGDAQDPAKITAADWTRLEDASRQIKARAELMARQRKIVVAGPGEKIEGADDPAEPDAQRVQGHIDANPTGFAQHARELAANAGIILEAAQKKDAGPVFKVAGKLDSVCDGCHERFWDPEAPKLPD